MLSSPSAAILALTVLALPASSQLLNALPRCIRDCINQSQFSNCQITDIACLCRASAGNFLPDLVTCMDGNCVDIDSNVLLAPLQFACELAGAPIPESAVENAENQGSSARAEVTKTVTMEDEGSATISTQTVTTTEQGSTHTIVYPVTIERTTTVSGEASTVTATSTRDGVTALIPIIIVSTDNEGSIYTTTTTQTGVISTYTTTDSEGSTVTEKSTFTETALAEQTSSSFSDSEESTTTTSTTLSSATVAGTQVTSSDSAESSGAGETTEETPASQSNSAPFMDTNSSGTRTSVGALIGLGLLAFVFAWV